MYYYFPEFGLSTFSALFLDFVCMDHKALAATAYPFTQVSEQIVWIACGKIGAKLSSKVKCDRHFPR